MLEALAQLVNPHTFVGMAAVSASLSERWKKKEATCKDIHKAVKIIVGFIQQSMIVLFQRDDGQLGAVLILRSLAAVRGGIPPA